MKDVLITSSVLILALLLLRQVFRKTISRRVQYALWALVLVRLLVPVSLPAMEHNVLSAVEPMSQRIDVPALYIEPVREQVSAPAEVPVIERTPADYQQVALDSATQDNTRVFTDQKQVTHTVEYARQISLNDLLRPIWHAGIAAMACWLVISNLRFWRKLRKGRTPYSVEGCRYPVYLVESGLPSPCLFGLFRPAVYLTPAAAASPESLRHVLAHEETHARHWDPLWSLLRGVCLAIYWFDPLVWIAAAVSKTDCELACDEGALRRLGQGERVAYGWTLLALIPVARRPADPMLAATTMTSGKRKLKERITRIAEDRQTAAAALFAVVAAAALLCAVTFTGAKVPGGETEARPLTGPELEYFNEEFFNNDTVGGFVHTNIHNQFLTSLYESPEDIDLYELFYCGTGSVGVEAEYGESDAMTEEERQLVCSFDPEGEEICPTDKLSVSAINSVLLANTGLTLEQTKQIGLENFAYLAEYNAYYHTHGDTNYFHSVQITAGTREGGTIRLYYPDSYAHYSEADWLCVTLEAQADGSYWFVSNQPCEKPVVPTVYPDGDPVLTISLEDLSPYFDAPAVVVTHHTDDCAEDLGGTWLEINGGIDIRSYRSTDGNTYAAIISQDSTADWDANCFLTLPEDDYSGGFRFGTFSDLFGHDGLVVSYTGRVSERQYNGINDYYYFTDEGLPVLLVRAYGTPEIIDLDGDGEFELAASAGGPAQLFFQRDNTLYCADVEALVEAAWPEAQYISFGGWIMYSRCLSLSGEVPIPDSSMRGTASRQLYFNGSELLLYRDGSTYTDHVKDTVDAPEDVLAAAREYVMSRYVQGVLCYDLVDGDIVQVQDDYDDWRITDLSGPYYEDIGGLRIEIWQLGYECHTSTQYHVSLAGGSYITEDKWCMIGYYGCDYLYFQADENGDRTYLYTAMENDCAPGTELFRTDMVNQLTSIGLLALEDVDGQTLLEMLSVQPAAFLNGLVENQPETVQTAVIEKLGAYIALGGSDSAAEAYASCVSYIDRWPSDLTPEAQALWTRLQAAAEGEVPLDGETALAQFTANPAAFLRSAAPWPEERQAEVCRALAAYYDGGPSASQARFRDAMRSVTQESLDSGGTAVYELLRTSCALPSPAERTAKDEEEIIDLVSDNLHSFRKSPGFLYLNIYELAIDENETSRAVSRCTASLLANGNGWTDEYTTRMAAVRAAYDSYYDFSKPGPWLSQENGVGAMYFYLLPDPISGTWEIWDSTGTSVPSEPSIDCLETAIHNAIMENCRNSYAASMPFQTEAHHVYAIQTLRPDCMFVYAEIAYHAYDKDSAGPTLENGCAFPVVLTFDASIENTLRLTEFWKPLDGDGYTSSIREKVLETEIADELIARAYSSQLSDQCDAAAWAWFESLKT